MDPYELIVLIIIAFPFLYIYYFTRRKIKIFKVYRHKTKGYSAVKDGLAWLAPPLNPLWFFHRGLWSIFFIYIRLFFIGALIHTELYGDLIMIPPDLWTDRDYIWIITQLIVFILFPLIKGNDWTARNILRKGYLFQESVGASTKKNAIAIVIENNTKPIYEEKEEGERGNISKEDWYDRLTSAYNSRTHAIVKMSLGTYFIYALIVSVAKEIHYHFGILIALVGLLFLIGESYKK